MGKLFKDMTTKELKSFAKSYYDMIYRAECYGTSDMLNYEGICEELNKRGYCINEDSKLRIVKEDRHNIDIYDKYNGDDQHEV